MEDRVDTTKVTRQREDQSQGQKGNQSYEVGVTRDEDTGSSSGSKGNQSYDREGK